jgi:hypothetical protein
MKYEETVEWAPGLEVKTSGSALELKGKRSNGVAL